MNLLQDDESLLLDIVPTSSKVDEISIMYICRVLELLQCKLSVITGAVGFEECMGQGRYDNNNTKSQTDSKGKQ